MWTTFDTAIVATGAIAAMSCALPGCFLLLRRSSMMGDAISHTVLPGIAAAYLLTGSRDSLPMFVGAIVVGVLTALLIQAVQRGGQVEEGAAMGVVFTSLFALGLVMIRRAADHVDLDPSCVLYGALELAPLDTVSVGGWDIPRAAISSGALLLINAVFIGIFYKELKLCAFDPGYARTQGIRVGALNLALMTLIAATTVAAFESVGSILVIAMLIVPAATAYLMTDRLPIMLVGSLVFGALSAALGHGMVVWMVDGLGLPDTSSAGMTGVAAGILFVAMALGSPKYGILMRAARSLQLALGIARDDVLAYLYRHGELDPLGTRPRPTASNLREAIRARVAVSAAIWQLRNRRLLAAEGGGIALTPAGRDTARGLVRSHRLWETYLVEKLGLRPDHVHSTAEVLEHITDRTMRESLSRETGDAPRDPHRSSIPPE